MRHPDREGWGSPPFFETDVGLHSRSFAPRVLIRYHASQPKSLRMKTHTHRLHSSSFSGLPYRIPIMNPKKEEPLDIGRMCYPSLCSAEKQQGSWAYLNSAESLLGFSCNSGGRHLGVFECTCFDVQSMIQ